MAARRKSASVVPCGRAWRPTAASTSRRRCRTSPARTSRHGAGCRSRRLPGISHSVSSTASSPRRRSTGSSVTRSTSPCRSCAGRRDLAARALSRPDAGVQGLRRAVPGAPVRRDPRRGWRPRDRPGGHVRRHRERGRPRIRRRARHPRRHALPGRKSVAVPGNADGDDRRQHHRAAGARHLRRLPADGEGRAARSRGHARRTHLRQLDQHRQARAAEFLLRARAAPRADAPEPGGVRRCRPAISATSPPDCWRSGWACKSAFRGRDQPTTCCPIPRPGALSGRAPCGRRSRTPWTSATLAISPGSRLLRSAASRMRSESPATG